MEPFCKVWGLERYARLISSEQGTPEWECYDNKEEKLELTLTSNKQLLLHYGKKQMLFTKILDATKMKALADDKLPESLYLVDSRSRIKGLTKGDSLMIITKIKEERRFRIKFSDDSGTKGTEICRWCVEILSKYFQIKVLVNEETSSTQERRPLKTLLEKEKLQQSGTSLTLSGEKQTVVAEDITLGQMAEAVLNTPGSCLPPVYSHLSCETSQDLDTLIKLCLTDPSFPSFVDSVEKYLDKIKEECS